MKLGLILLLVSVCLIALFCTIYHFNRPQSQAFAFKTEAEFSAGFSYLHRPLSAKTIIIIPPTGGMNVIDKLYAEDLYKHGMDVYILTDCTGLHEYALDLGVHQRFYTHVQKAIASIISHVQSPKIGILGTSVGGLHTSIAMSTHDRLGAGLVITAGTPIPEVVVYSNQAAMVKAKSERYKMFSFKDDNDYVKQLSAAFHLDLRSLPRKFEGKKLGVVIAESDETVPTINQKKLRDFWKAQTVANFNHDHFYTILRMGFLERDKVVRFFKDF